MNKEKNNSTSHDAIISEKKSTNIIWLLPFIALLIGIWLIYKSIVEAGVEITLHFDKDIDISVGRRNSGLKVSLSD